MPFFSQGCNNPSPMLLKNGSTYLVCHNKCATPRTNDAMSCNVLCTQLAVHYPALPCPALPCPLVPCLHDACTVRCTALNLIRPLMSMFRVTSGTIAMMAASISTAGAAPIARSILWHGPLHQPAGTPLTVRARPSFRRLQPSELFFSLCTALHLNLNDSWDI